MEINVLEVWRKAGMNIVIYQDSSGAFYQEPFYWNQFGGRVKTENSYKQKIHNIDELRDYLTHTGFKKDPVIQEKFVIIEIEELQQGPRLGQLLPGVYELPTGEIYVVKPNKDKTRLYAKRLVETPSERLTETGKHVDFDFQYEKGAIFRIKQEYLMPLERAKKLMIRYGKCIVCGRRLKRAVSVERGIGPVCIKYFRGNFDGKD